MSPKIKATGLYLILWATLGAEQASAWLPTSGTRTGPTLGSALSATGHSSYLDGLSTTTTKNNQVTREPSQNAVSSSDLHKHNIISSSLPQVPVLTLEHADAIASQVVQVCRRNQFAPIVVHVIDPAGHTMVSKRMDQCSLVGASDFAYAKAYACLATKSSSRNFRDKYTADEASAKFGQMLSMVAITGGKMAPFPGGILLQYDGHIVGAVGVSGAAGDEDEYCAIRAVAEVNIVGLTTIPDEPSCSTAKD